MTQKLKCPHCAGEVTLEQLIQTADLAAFAKAQAAFGEDWPLIREYLDCFRPASGKPLAVKKMLRLGREVWEMWHARRFEFNRQEYAVGREEFRKALRTTCNQVSLGLTNHNYLKKVLVGAAEKTSQRRERDLREREERMMAEERPASQTGQSRAGLTPEQKEELHRLGRAVRRAKTPEAKAEAQRLYSAYLWEVEHGTDMADHQG